MTDALFLLGSVSKEYVVSPPEKAVFALLIFIGCALVTGVIALTRPIVLKIGFIARVIAALSPIVCGDGLRPRP